MPQDFNQMQAQAIRYAREMQQRATKPAQPEARQSLRQENKAEAFPSPDEVFGHRNPWSQARETPFCKAACPVKNILGSGSKNSSPDNDIMLLMALLLVLSQDGGDKMLMLALLYIMT